MKSKIYSLVQMILIIALTGCSNQEPDLILVSKDSRHRIEKWLSSIDPEIDFREFYFIPEDSLDYFLDKADGIVIGGGEDINPAMYGKPNKEVLDDLVENTANYFREREEEVLNI